jgi:hypothetical protein
MAAKLKSSSPTAFAETSKLKVIAAIVVRIGWLRYLQ